MVWRTKNRTNVLTGIERSCWEGNQVLENIWVSGYFSKQPFPRKWFGEAPKIFTSQSVWPCTQVGKTLILVWLMSLSSASQSISRLQSGWVDVQTQLEVWITGTMPVIVPLETLGPQRVQKESWVKSYFPHDYSRENSISLIFDPEKLSEGQGRKCSLKFPPSTLTHFLPFYWDIHWVVQAEGQQ